MTILTILGFVLFSTFAVFGFVDTIFKIKQLNKQHEELIKQIKDKKISKQYTRR